MKLRIKRNFVPTLWDQAVTYRKWALEEIDKGTDQDSIDHWQSEFLNAIELLEKITTESHCTLHDMATFEAKEKIEAYKKALQVAYDLREELKTNGVTL